MTNKKTRDLASLFPWKYKKEKNNCDLTVVNKCVWQIVSLAIAIGIGGSIGFLICGFKRYIVFLWVGILTSILHFLLLKWNIDSLVSAVLSKRGGNIFFTMGHLLGYIGRMVMIASVLGIVGWFCGLGAFLSSVFGVFAVRIAIFIYGLFV